MTRTSFGKIIAIFFVACGIQAAHAQQKKNSFAITEDLLRSHLRFLAADELEGRETGERGQKIAAQYIASVFDRCGLVPAGDSGTYFQHFPTFRSRIGDHPVVTATAGGKTSIFTGTSQQFSVLFPSVDTVHAPLIFAGYGIDDSSRYGWSDYAGIDMRGKVVLMFAGVPACGDTLRPFGRDRTRWHDAASGMPAMSKVSAARVAGAAAVLIVTNPDGSPFAGTRTQHRRGNRFSSLTLQPPSATNRATPVLLISRDLADTLLRPSGWSANALRHTIDSMYSPHSFIIPDVEMTVIAAREIDTMITENVVASLDGCDRKLKQDVVVFSAHYDHIGRREDGAVYNGADDDGSGTAAVLALAEHFARSSRKPRRSMLFLCVTGEEKGLLGSAYYTDHPTVPLDRIVCDLNIDMIGRIDSAHAQLGHPSVYVIGSKRISPALDSILQSRNAKTTRLDLDYRFDSENDPHQFYRRSDHYNFARHGVPVVFFFDGEHPDYHRTTDDVERIDFESMERIVQLIREVGAAVADRAQRLRSDPPK